MFSLSNLCRLISHIADQPRVQASFPYDTVEPGYLDLQTGDELIVNRRDENGKCN